MTLEQDIFFDINKFPAKHGMIVFPISMSRIYNSQSGDKCFDYLQEFEKKAVKPLVGTSFIYTDSLYRRHQQESSESIKKYFNMMFDHRNAYLKKLRKTLYLEKAAAFFVWDQVCFNVEKFDTYLDKVIKFYQEDKKLQEYVKRDIEKTGRDFAQNNISFVLEEMLMSYLITKGKVRLPNDYVQDHEEWILLAYPGNIGDAFTYFYQRNLFNMNNEKNIYQNCFYNLDNQKLYDYTRITLN